MQAIVGVQLQADLVWLVLGPLRGMEAHTAVGELAHARTHAPGLCRISCFRGNQWTWISR